MMKYSTINERVLQFHFAFLEADMTVISCTRAGTYVE